MGGCWAWLEEVKEEVKEEVQEKEDSPGEELVAKELGEELRAEEIGASAIVVASCAW